MNSVERSGSRPAPSQSAALGNGLVGGERGVAVRAGEKVADIAIRAVLEVAGQPLDAAIHAHRLVDGARAEAPARALKEAHLPVGVEPAVADPAAPEDVA